MRILVLSWKDLDAVEAGGAERYLEAVTRVWADWGHTVTLLGPRPRGLPRVGRRGAVEVLRMGNRHTVFPLARAHLRRHRHRYDAVVDAVSTRPFLAHRVVGARATALYFQVAHEVWNREFSPPMALLGRRLLEPCWLRRMRDARVVAISESTAADLARWRVPTRAIASPGPTVAVAARRTRPPGDAPRLVFVGRLSATKRAVDAAIAFGRIRRTCLRASLDIIGEGRARTSIEEMRLDGLTLHGRVDDRSRDRLLAAADLMLLPGTREGWGLVAMEAAALGVPVVAYDIGGFRDAIVDGETGVLTAPSPQALADAALALLADGARWLQLSANAQTRAQRFTWEAAAERILGVMEEGSSAPGPGRGSPAWPGR